MLAWLMSTLLIWVGALPGVTGEPGTPLSCTADKQA